jgi:hypothetical protein
MLVQVNTDNHIENSTSLQDWVRREVEVDLGRFEPQLTRVEVYLSDLNSHKNAQVDKQCTIEVRIGGLEPIAVTKEAGTLEAAVDAALDVVSLTLDSRLERLQEKKGRTPMGGEPT